MIKINQLEIENTKRIKAVKIQPSKNGLTVIGGRNGQGKTSVLDAIAWALCGDRYRPSAAARDGSLIPPNLHIIMDNGLVVERSGKNSSLKVIDPDGNKGGQQLLNDFISELAVNLPKFMQAPAKEKAQTLLQIIGVGDQLYELETKEQELYNKRRAIGQIKDQKQKFAKEQIYYPDAPKEPVAASELIKQQQEILVKNGENQRKRENLAKLQREKNYIEEQLNELKIKYEGLCRDVEIAEQSALDLHDEATEELERNIANIEEINVKVRANLDKDKAEEDAQQYADMYNTLTAELDDIRQKKIDLLKNADLPLPGLLVSDGDLVYNGQKWDCMSGAEQLKVATAIVRRLKPECGFVLLDKLEQMDIDTMHEFGSWLESEGLQAIATRVSTGGECSVIIEDGYNVEPEQKPKWKEGEF